MVVAIDNLESALQKYDDPNFVYTPEEEKAVKELLELIDGDEELKIWKKYAVKSAAAVGLRFCDGSPTTAFKALKDMHPLLTKKYSSLLGSIDPANFKALIERKTFQIVKQKPGAPAILICRVGNWHISDGSIEEIVLAGVVYVWWVLRTNPNLLANGLLEIQDMAGFKLKHARQVTVDLVKMGLKFHACVPPSATALAKGIVAFNSFALVEETYNLFKGILPKDIKSLVHITKNETSVITKLVDPAFLPVEFGGTIPDVEAYMEGLEEAIVKDEELFQIMRQLQDEVLKTYGIKRIEKKKKEKKDKKDKTKVDGEKAMA
ncbi:clavesin-1 [Folsomia candida]|uniref:clavesin-1 n=1 Tax=Folsomia candida TaxID=158441 RepID=UPI000B8F0FF1|nr:clavesin-1 [Folsomia candida]